MSLNKQLLSVVSSEVVEKAEIEIDAHKSLTKCKITKQNTSKRTNFIHLVV